MMSVQEKSEWLQRDQRFAKAKLRFEMDEIRATAREAVVDWRERRSVPRQVAYAERAFDLGDINYLLYCDALSDLGCCEVIDVLKQEVGFKGFEG
jgi:hypothetical protein